jgi:hypothetical protein
MARYMAMFDLVRDGAVNPGAGRGERPTPPSAPGT